MWTDQMNMNLNVMAAAADVVEVQKCDTDALEDLSPPKSTSIITRVWEPIRAAV